MHTYSINGVGTLHYTRLGSKFSTTIPSRHYRARSEPPLASNHVHTISSRSTNINHQTRQETTFKPAPTEIEDLDLEYVNSQPFDIKVRDFAYEPRLPSESFSSPSSIANPDEKAQGGPGLLPELFDQYKGIAEYEYRLLQCPRTVPIAGKTIRRLLDIKWVLYEEAEARLDEMDWAALKEHDKKVRESGGYPWRPCKWSKVPNAEERKRLLQELGSWFMGCDRLRKQLEQRAYMERIQMERAEEALRRQLRKTAANQNRLPSPRSSSPSKKRVFERKDAIASNPKQKRPRLAKSQPLTSLSQPHLRPNYRPNNQPSNALTHHRSTTQHDPRGVS